jgi:formylglycine-generating enzyme
VDVDIATETMAWVPGGRFRMGSESHYEEEGPVHTAIVDGFWIDRHAVTNREYADFVDASGYTTVAERPLDPRDFPGASAENLVPGSMVFTGTPGPVDLRHLSQWWAWVPGASWQHPRGPRSSLRGLDDHPVVHIAYEDAEAFADWAGKSLPTEVEWERAARGGLEAATFVWGDEPEHDGEPMANYWHGDFPWRHARGYGSSTPVGSFPANGYGLFDMAGNVWEWTTDWWASRHVAAEGECCVTSRVAMIDDSYDPAQPQFKIPRKVIKGGSFLCADSYCLRYRPAARRPQMIDTGMSHIGFRCIIRRSLE